MAVERFLRSPKPSSETVALLERALESARNGSLRAVAIVAISPVHRASFELAGELDEIKSNALLGGLMRVKQQLLNLLSCLT